MQKKRNQRSDDDEHLQRKKTRTGLKHSALNKIQLMEHDPYDNQPYMLLLPALRMCDVLEWIPGTAYDIVCLVGPESVASVEASVDYRDRFHKCQAVQDARKVEFAIGTLRSFVAGMADSLLRMEDFDDLAALANCHDKIPDNEVKSLKATKERLQTGGTVILPVFSDTKFFNVNIAQRRITQSVPDPYLMCVKAAVNWCNMHDQRVLPGCVYEYEDEDSCSEDDSCEVYNPPSQVAGEPEDVSDLDSLSR